MLECMHTMPHVNKNVTGLCEYVPEVPPTTDQKRAPDPQCNRRKSAQPTMHQKRTPDPQCNRRQHLTHNCWTVSNWVFISSKIRCVYVRFQSHQPISARHVSVLESGCSCQVVSIYMWISHASSQAYGKKSVEFGCTVCEFPIKADKCNLF